jgi:hypothetical protein
MVETTEVSFQPRRTESAKASAPHGFLGPLRGFASDKGGHGAPMTLVVKRLQTIGWRKRTAPPTFRGHIRFDRHYGRCKQQEDRARTTQADLESV